LTIFVREAFLETLLELMQGALEIIQ